MKNVVIIGGGTGLSVMLRGMKSIPDIGLNAIVTVADDGGSTGRLRCRIIPEKRLQSVHRHPACQVSALVVTIGAIEIARPSYRLQHQ